MRRHLCLALAAAALFAGGCAHRYVTPSGGVTLSEFADEDLATFYAREPASPFPANLAILRVQDSGYASHTVHGYGHGRFTVVTTRDVESDEAFERIGRLALVSGVAPIGRMLLPANANTLEDLRTPAARLRTDMLVIYSIDTTFTVDGRALGPLSMISLGLLPNKKAHVTTTVAGVLLDVRTGFVYGTTEATAREEQRASIWSTELAIDTARQRAEQQAFDAFVGEFETLWNDVLDVHAAAAPRAAQKRQPDGYHRIDLAGGRAQQ